MKRQTSTVNEQLAIKFAGMIIRGKLFLAGKLNRGISRLGKKRQVRLLVLFCSLFALGLIGCVLLPFGRPYRLHLKAPSYPAHIGAASGVPPAKNVFTDHLTPKNK